ncbi:MAG TPA: type II secretion system F family protein [Gaiellaceae bacterium]|nr:type II secretion system F family protein [Gaiellaceae bacterium]
MTLRRRTFCLAALLGVLAAPAVAGASVEIRGVDATSYPRAQATVVTSKPSKSAPQLTENGVPAAGVFAQNLGEARSICLALDHSRSMKGEPLQKATAAARAFVASKLPTDRLCVTSFATKPLLLTPFTTVGSEADQALAGIKVDPVKGTTLYDDILLASETLAEEADSRARIVIIVTDGNVWRSTATLAEAIKAAQEAETTVYVVAIESKAFTPGPLRYLAKRTGGRYFGTPSPDALPRIYAELANELKRTWRLDYITSGRPGESPKLVAHVPGLGRDTALAAIPATAEEERAGGLLPTAAYGRGGSMGLAVLVGLLMLIALVLVFTSATADRVRAQVQRHIAPKPKRRKAKEKKERLQSLSGLFQVTENALGKTRVWGRLRGLIEKADMPLKTAELFYMMCASAILVGAIMMAIGVSGFFAVLFLGVGALLPVGFVWFKAHRRLQAFENQLPDLLIGVAASLKAGHSFKQALQGIVDEGSEPASKEFKRVLTESRLGRPLDDSLADMAERVGSKNLSFIVTAVSVQSQVGGSLASLFDMVADTVRNRQQFARKIKALTAMGRMSAYVLVALPFFLAGALALMNPGYMAPLFQTSAGHKMIGVSLCMMAVGSLLLKKIVSFKG